PSQPPSSGHSRRALARMRLIASAESPMQRLIVSTYRCPSSSRRKPHPDEMEPGRFSTTTAGQRRSSRIRGNRVRPWAREASSERKATSRCLCWGKTFRTITFSYLPAHEGRLRINLRANLRGGGILTDDRHRLRDTGHPYHLGPRRVAGRSDR